jgi:phospholipase C
MRLRISTLGMAAALTLLVGLSACGDSDQSTGQVATPTSTATATPTAPCSFQAGALPDETLPADAPRGAQIPIEHVIVLMQENRSFDSYFGRLPAAGHANVDGLPAGASNPDSDGTAVPVFHQNPYCTEDTNHEWSGSHDEFDDGRNDGFVIANNPDGARAMGYYDQTDLPFYYGLANTFAIADRYFCSLLGPTYPNRFFLLAATAFGHIRNDMMQGGFTQRTIFDVLDEHQISWKVYYNDVPFTFLFKLKSPRNRVRYSQFLTDAQAGTLPQVAFIDPAFSTLSGPETDEHPPASIQVGQQFVASVIDALFQSPNWASSALFLTYDEHGGFYDHVPPPPACVPDDIPPMLEAGDPAAEYDRYGFRVPFVLVSPYARPGFVSHAIYDHTSILRFIETRFGLPALTNRDANADPMLGLFDFSHPAFLNPPTLPAASLDAARQAQCEQDFPNPASSGH